MASKALASTSLLLALNLLFFTLVSCTHHIPCPPPPVPKPKCPRPPAPKPICPPPPPHHPKKETCPRDALKLGVCANVLGGLLASLLEPLLRSHAAVFLKVLLILKLLFAFAPRSPNVLGINLNVPVDLSLLLNYCGKKVPTGFQCA